MYGFKEYLVEFKIEVPKPSETKGIKRIDMPQVKQKDFFHLLKWLQEHGVKTTHKRVPARTLKPIQKEFNKDIVQRSLERQFDPDNTEPKPIIVSSDNYIIDGHHRWLAMKNIGSDIKIVHTNIKFDQLLALIIQYPRVYFKSKNAKS